MKEKMRPELIWAGKYDEKRRLRPVERTILPFQVVETINESKADREKAQRDLLTGQARIRRGGTSSSGAITRFLLSDDVRAAGPDGRFYGHL